MALLAPNNGELLMLGRIIGTEIFASGDTLTLWLYKEIGDSNATPKEGDTWVNYVPTFGDSEKLLAADDWTIASAAGDTTSATFAQQTFTFSGADSVAGYAITSTNLVGDTTILWAEEFSDGPYVIPGGGGTVKVTPYIELE